MSTANTELMLADFFTKPIQGALFKKFCDIVMGRVPIELPTTMESITPLSKERVGNTNISSVDTEETKPSTGETPQNATSENVTKRVTFSEKGITFPLKSVLKNNKKMRSTNRTYAETLRGPD